MARQARRFDGPLPLLDPVLGRAALVVELGHRPALRLLIGHDESRAQEQLSEVELYLISPQDGGEGRVLSSPALNAAGLLLISFRLLVKPKDHLEFGSERNRFPVQPCGFKFPLFDSGDRLRV